MWFGVKVVAFFLLFRVIMMVAKTWEGAEQVECEIDAGGLRRVFRRREGALNYADLWGRDCCCVKRAFSAKGGKATWMEKSFAEKGESWQSTLARCSHKFA